MNSVFTVMLLDPRIRILFSFNIAWIARGYPFVYYYSERIYGVISWGPLTHCNLQNMVTILQMVFSIAFLWMQFFVICCKYHWRVCSTLFLRAIIYWKQIICWLSLPVVKYCLNLLILLDDWYFLNWITWLFRSFIFYPLHICNCQQYTYL